MRGLDKWGKNRHAESTVVGKPELKGKLEDLGTVGLGESAETRTEFVLLGTKDKRRTV
jgi:hypothetical protein